MNRILTRVLSLTLTLSLFFGCKDDGVSIDNRAVGLYAKVVDPGGSPIAGASIHYIFYTETSPVTLNVAIQYNLSTPQVVTLKILDPFDRQVATPIDSVQQPAGVQSILVSDSSFTNGVYSYRLQTGDSLRVGSFFIRDDDTGRLQRRTPLTFSDQVGQFFLSPKVLGIGRTFQGQFTTETISDSISIVLVKANYRTLIQSFRLDVTKPTDRTFALEPN